MKRIVMLIVLLILVNALISSPIQYEQALEVAEHHISVNEKIEYTISGNFEIKDSNEITLAYVLNLRPVGFIATSSDTEIYPVIGYSFLNNFSNLDIPQNTGYQYLKKDMKLRLEAIPFTSDDVKQSNRILWNNYLDRSYKQTRNRNNIYPPEGYSPTQGWIETQWHQFAPYKNFCPLDPENMIRSVVGCGATALAQILNFHKYIGDVSFDDSDDYISSMSAPSFTIDDDYLLYDFPSFPQLNTYLDELKIAFENYDLPSEDMIAALNFASGIPVEMQYSSSGSGIYGIQIVAQALLDKFDFDSAVYTQEINADFFTILQNEMMEARPVDFIAFNSYGGHSFICDGYNGNNNTFHLNMGWGGGSDGWYSLPENIPNFPVLEQAVLNIEGGTIPFDVSGLVYADDAPLAEAYITLDGQRFHEIFVDDPNGYFGITILFPGEYEVTAIIELAGGGYFYKNEVVTLDENNDILIIFLDNFETISGSVSAAINPENTRINIYQDDTLVSCGVADVNGDFSIPGVLPGDYVATAGLSGNHFDIQDVTISANNQIIDFQLEEYPYEFTFNFAGEPIGQIQLFQFMSCAIRFSGRDLINHENDIFSQVEFIAPFNPDEGEIYAQIWKSDILLTEQQVNDFTEGEWINVVLDDLFKIDVDVEYFIGYRFYSISGNVAAAYHDAGPMAEGNGAYIYTTLWEPLSATYNYNFCIKAVIASQNSTSSPQNETFPMVNYLGNNYPNPFNPTTTINYSLKENSKVSLNIYNIKGQKVKTLVDESKESGHHQVIWYGTNNNQKQVSSGLYFYRLTTNKKTLNNKMLLLK